MSRKDPRRALLLRLPIALRRSVAVQIPGDRPMPAKCRALLVRALAQGLLPLDVTPGALRPSALQLSRAERAALAGHGQDAERVALGLIAAALAAER